MTVETDTKAPVHELLASASSPSHDSARIPSSGSRARVARPAATDGAFNAVFDLSAEALVLIDLEGTIQRANSRARELLRLQSGKHGIGIGNILSGGQTRKVSEFWTRPAEPLPRSVDAHLGSGAPLRVTLRAVIPGSGHLLLCIEEGSVVQRAEARWRQVESELRGVLESAQAAFVVFSASGEIRFSNARFCELLGLDLHGIRNVRGFDELAELIAPRFRRPESFAAPWRSFIETGGEPGHDELEITRPTRRVIERFFRPIIGTDGRAVGWLERYSDVTGSREVQSQMLQTEKMAALGQLVSGIAHELNNPLTAIMGYAQLLLGKELTPAQVSEAERVFQEAERARRIVKNLLYFARENRAERTRVELNEVIERTLALRSYELRVEDIAVECDLAPHLPATLADPFQLQQVILNLLVNAEQAVLEGRGHGHVWIRTRHMIEGLANKTRDRIVLEVADDGPGIPSEIASRVFDPFFTSKPSGVGTGLGLSIVYGIVHQHGGDVAFDNRPGGARFIVDLPVIDASAVSRLAAESASRALAAAEELKPVAPARILVVEDEPTVAQLIVDVLRERGHQVEAALDGQEALRRLTRSPYDLLVCDLRMPHFDGQAVYQSLRRAGSPLLNRILFITGDVIGPQTREFLEPNQLPYLAKPFLVEELKLAVNRLLDTAEDRESKTGSAAAAGDATAEPGAAESSRAERKMP